MTISYLVFNKANLIHRSCFAALKFATHVAIIWVVNLFGKGERSRRK